MSPPSSCKLAILKIMLVLLTTILRLGESVVVDGNKKMELSAVKKQKSDEELSIDAFNTKTCGMSNPNARDHEFINMAREGQFPWIVSLQIKVLQDGSLNEQLRESQKSAPSSVTIPDQPAMGQPQQKLDDLHFCSGSFISDRWILSAAHCFVGDTLRNYYANDKLKVVAGSHRVSSRHRLNRNLTIERIYYHAKFNKAMPVGYDIALVELKQPVMFEQKRPKDEFGEQNRPYMNAICLPIESKKYSFNESARIAGWGLSSAKDVTTMPSKLLTTDILLTNQDQCVEDYQKALRSDAPKRQKQNEDDFICASYRNTRDACQSDSGGPLMQYVNRKAVVVGIVSYGIGCATKGVPGLYTRTSAYINWIKEITNNGKQAKADFKVYERADDQLAKLNRETHRNFESTTTKKPPPPSSQDQLTTMAPSNISSTSQPATKSSTTASPDDEMPTTASSQATTSQTS